MAKKTLKTEDVFEIGTRSLMIQHSADRSTRWNYVPVVLHIINRQGWVNGYSMIGKPEKHFVHLTKCNRVAQHWTTSDRKEVSVANVDGRIRFCNRCGTSSDFFAAIEAYEQKNLQWLADYKKEEQERSQAQEAKWEREITATSANAFDLAKLGVTLRLTDHENQVAYSKEVNGRLYTFTITTREEQLLPEN